MFLYHHGPFHSTGIVNNVLGQHCPHQGGALYHYGRQMRQEEINVFRHYAHEISTVLGSVCEMYVNCLMLIFRITQR